MTHDAETLNATVRYTMWTVFALEEVLPEDDDERAELIAAALAAVADDGLVVRGWYDVAGLRADADLMVWWHAETIEEVQGAYQRLRASDLGRHLLPVWSVVGLHRPAEFNRSHVPAFLAGEPAGDYMTRVPVRALVRLVRAARGRPPPDARRARPGGPRVRRRARQHRLGVRARRLRVDPRVRGARAAPDRRPHARPARHRRPPARARGGAVLHRPARDAGDLGGPPARG